MKIYFIVQCKNGNTVPKFDKVFFSKKLAEKMIEDYQDEYEYYHGIRDTSISLCEQEIENVGRNVYTVETYYGYDYNFGSSGGDSIHDVLGYSEFKPNKACFREESILSEEEFGNKLLYDCFEDKGISRIKKFRVVRTLA